MHRASGRGEDRDVHARVAGGGLLRGVLLYRAGHPWCCLRISDLP